MTGRLRRLASAIGLRRTTEEHTPVPARDGRSEATRERLPDPRKVFGIGYNKTGSSTLEEVFRRMGYLVPVQWEQESALTEEVQRGNYGPLRDFVSRYEAFQDMPFSQDMTFVACDVLFPGSKFILTVRDPDDWFRSMLNFHRKVFGFDSPDEIGEAFFKGKDFYIRTNYIYENKRRMVQRLEGHALLDDWSLLYDPDHYKAIYLNRNREILSYFQHRPDDLLVIDITREADTRRICGFLGRDPAEAIPMPHMNKT
jgi:hypothetical protein